MISEPKSTCYEKLKVTKETKESRDEKLMKHLIDHCNENPMNYLDDNEYFEKIKSKVKNYVNL